MLSYLCSCNRFGKIWYIILVTFLQGYIIFNAIRQYLIFKGRYYNPRFGGEWDLAPLHFYLGCIIVSLSLMGFFLYFSLVNARYGFTSSIVILHNRNEQQNSLSDIAKLVWKLMKEKVPYSQILHLIISMCLLLPLPVVHMEEIRNEALSPDLIWTVDLDFFSEHFEWLKSDSLPNTAILRNMHYITKSNTISIEFINFLIASLLILLKMPTVFWAYHKCFSILYSTFVFLHCITFVMVYEAGSILIKCSGNDELLPTVKETLTKVHYTIIIILIIIHFFLTLSSFLGIMVYGNTQLIVAWVANYKSFRLQDPGSRKRNCWVVLVVALGFSMLIIYLIINSVIYASLLRYFHAFKNPIFVATIILGIINILFSFLTWFTFAIKTNWVFNLQLSKFSEERDKNINDGYKLSGVPDAIYGCFHNNITLSSSSSQSSGPGTMRTMEGQSVDVNGHGNNYQNYIYMQSNAMQIPTISEDFDENPSNSKSCQRSNEKTSTSTFGESIGNSREIVSISDTGLHHSNENMNSDSYRSLQLYGGKRYGKLVKFQEMQEEAVPVLRFGEKIFSSNNLNEKEFDFLKVPDILKVNKSDFSCSHSDSSLDRISSNASSKYTIDPNEQGLCSEV